jgi:hypothetical protein
VERRQSDVVCSYRVNVSFKFYRNGPLWLFHVDFVLGGCTDHPSADVA